MNKFSRDFVASIEGSQPEQSTKELVGGARILQIFELKYGRALGSINPMHNLSATEIGIAIRNSTGARPSLFMPDKAFEMLVRPQIRLLEPSSLRCVDLVYEELMKFCHSCTSTELARYPRLQAQIIEVVSELLRERLGPTIDSVKSLIQIQMAYINTKHPLFQNMTRSFIMQQEEQSKRKAATERQAELQEARSDVGSGDEGEPSVGFPEAKVNGRHSLPDDRQHKARSSSASFHDRTGLTSGRHSTTPSMSQLRPVSPVGFGSSTQHSSQTQVKETLCVTPHCFVLV
jgi:dynamin 1-like protein